MKKQFDLIEQLYEASKENQTRIKQLSDAINEEVAKLKVGLLNAYDNDAETLFLVQFHSHSLYFFKATKTHLHEVKLNWYLSIKKVVKEPSGLVEANYILENYKDPTSCSISSHEIFGYFDDINRRWDRIDFIAEETNKKRFLFEITEADFLKAVNTVSIFYGLKIPETA